MDALDRLAEERIRDAVDRGEFDDLAGAGEPLRLDDDTMIPAELRAAYRVLRNAGFVPEEVRLRVELRTLEALVDADGAPAGVDGAERAFALRRLEMLRFRLAARRGGERALALDDAYRERVVEHLAPTGPEAGP